MAHLIVIGGPTASGKTKAAIALAKYLNCPILSADSRQFFREMNIGTAKPTLEELAQAQHFFIDNKSVAEDYSSGDYEREALDLLRQLFQDNPYVILVGGSGLYIDAVCKGMDQLPKSDEVRAELNEIFEIHGLAPLQEELKKRDPTYFSKCDFQNPIRVIRALEIIRLSGLTMEENFSKNHVQRFFQSTFFVLDLPRAELYERINIRVDLMINQGLLHEVMSLEPYRNKNALQTVGYKELFDFLEGKTDLNRAIELIKQNSRRYAKRQITWFKRYDEALWVHPREFDNISQFENKYLNHLRD